MLNTREMGTLETTWSSYFTHCLVYQSEDYFIQNYEEGEPTRCTSEGVDVRMGYMISNMVFFKVTNNLLCIFLKCKFDPHTKYRHWKTKVWTADTIRNTWFVRVHTWSARVFLNSFWFKICQNLSVFEKFLVAHAQTCIVQPHHFACQYFVKTLVPSFIRPQIEGNDATLLKYVFSWTDCLK